MFDNYEKFYGGKVEFDDMFKWTVLPEGDGKYGIAKQGYAPAYPVIEGVQGRFMMKKFAAWWVPDKPQRGATKLLQSA